MYICILINVFNLVDFGQNCIFVHSLFKLMYEKIIFEVPKRSFPLTLLKMFLFSFKNWNQLRINCQSSPKSSKQPTHSNKKNMHMSQPYL